MNVMLLEEAVGVVSVPVGVPVYDFDFGLHFKCTHPLQFEPGTLGVFRIGAIEDYAAEYLEKQSWGLNLVNTLEQHILASELEAWYGALSDLTPRTKVYVILPAPQEIEASFSWPVFIKGSRQTSKHNPELSVVMDREHYERVVKQYREDPILSWQKPVVREFVPLMPVPGEVPGKLRPSLEFRSFWWNGECVGTGRYWYQIPKYEALDLDAGLRLARQAAERLKVPFLVVDFAKTASGDWVIIECNDAQESGYAAIPPQTLWTEILRCLQSG